MIECLASTEALIDFGEGEGIEEGLYNHGQELYERDRHKPLTLQFMAVRDTVSTLHTTISKHLHNKHGEIIRSGVRLAIFGPPNAGKSSLLNFLGSIPSRRSCRLPLTAAPSTARRSDSDTCSGDDERRIGAVP
jgi:tRNA U34 5-carboxymethylaminomethyl modifying GTPase MnmE/TrmE